MSTIKEEILNKLCEILYLRAYICLIKNRCNRKQQGLQSTHVHRVSHGVHQCTKHPTAGQTLFEHGFFDSVKETVLNYPISQKTPLPKKITTEKKKTKAKTRDPNTLTDTIMKTAMKKLKQTFNKDSKTKEVSFSLLEKCIRTIIFEKKIIDK